MLIGSFGVDVGDNVDDNVDDIEGVWTVGVAENVFSIGIWSDWSILFEVFAKYNNEGNVVQIVMHATKNKRIIKIFTCELRFFWGWGDKGEEPSEVLSGSYFAIIEVMELFMWESYFLILPKKLVRDLYNLICRDDCS